MQNRWRPAGVLLGLAILATFVVPLSAVHAQAFGDGAWLDKQFELLSRMNVNEDQVVSFFYTSAADSTEGRLHNIKKAVRRIDDEVVGPAQRFSFNATVGNADIAEDGWEPAGVIVNGQMTEGYGGGICQVSSTLYNAVLGAGLTVVERHSHSKHVGYVPVGHDATVAYGILDFQFSNPYPFPIQIEAKILDDSHVAVALVRADS